MKLSVRKQVAAAACALVAAGLAAGCGGSGGHSGSGSASVATTTSSNVGSVSSSSSGTTSSTTAVQAAPPVVPLILVHGISSQPQDWGTYIDRLGQGRTTIPALYAAEADGLQAGSLSPNIVVAFGYYQESINGPVTEDASIGGCPVARTDGLQSAYPESYADRLRRVVDGVRRATGAPRVDLVCHSMGGLVGRAYTKWLSVDATGQSAVRRLFLIASPSRGVNALEATMTAFSLTGPLAYRRQGECLELCAEDDYWGGQSYVAQLDADWDGFCSSHGIEYAGMSLLGTVGPDPGLNPTAPGGIPPASTTSTGGYLTGRAWAIQSFLAAVSTFSLSDLSQLPLLGYTLSNVISETATALGPGDGVVRFASSRLDESPFLAAQFFGQYEGAHANLPDPERGYANSFNLECVREYCLATQLPQVASCTSYSLTDIHSPGKATWLEATFDMQGDACMACQLVESTLDSNGNALYAIGYGAPLRPGKQTLAFDVVTGGGNRSYRLVVYGPAGELEAQDNIVFSLDDGVQEVEPLASVAIATATPVAGGAQVSLTLGSNATSGDPAQAFCWRLDHGSWSPWQSSTGLALPALATGIHRFEVLARSSSNAAALTVEQRHPTGVGLSIDSYGNVTLLP